MGDVVSLRLHRKRKERGAREERAAENRAKFGRTKAEKSQENALRTLTERRLEGHRVDDDEGGP